MDRRTGGPADVGVPMEIPPAGHRAPAEPEDAFNPDTLGDYSDRVADGNLHYEYRRDEHGDVVAVDQLAAARSQLGRPVEGIADRLSRRARGDR